MDAQDLKQYIYDNNQFTYILEELGMHNVKWHSNKYISCSFPDGDNKQACIVYNNESINVTAYTRDIADKYGYSDIISLICFVRKEYISMAIKWTCGILGLDYYMQTKCELPMSLQWTRMIKEMNSNIEYEHEEHIKPIDEKILSYYKPFVNDMFKMDNISYETQQVFEVGFDLESNRITLPIRDELSVLVGVKGRLYTDILDECEQKYIYLEKCAKSKILYGLHLTLDMIIECNKVFVVEAEKGVMQLWDMGICNAVSIGGKSISRTQVEKLTRLGVDIVLAFDQDVLESDYSKEINKFISGVNVFYMCDKYNKVLNPKESPCDRRDAWETMQDKYTYKAR